MVEITDAKTSSSAGETQTLSSYTLSSSDNPGAVITPVLLTGENYNEWASEMINALRAKKKIGFVEGTISVPAADSADYEAWSSVNSMVVGWLRTAITPRVRSTVLFITNAHDLWVNLKERFCVANKVRVHHLRTQLASCRQDGLPVIEYYGKLANMWDELYTYKPLPVCSCTAGTMFAKDREEEKVHQFVIGLDESRFGNVINSIIDTDPSPDLAQAYSRVIRDEQRLVSAKTREQQHDAVGFATRRDNSDMVPARRDRFLTDI